MENTNTDFRIRDLIDPKEKRDLKSRIPVKSEFQITFKNSCKELTNHAPVGGWRI